MKEWKITYKIGDIINKEIEKEIKIGELQGIQVAYEYEPQIDNKTQTVKFIKKIKAIRNLMGIIQDNKPLTINEMIKLYNGDMEQMKKEKLNRQTNYGDITNLEENIKTLQNYEKIKKEVINNDKMLKSNNNKQDKKPTENTNIQENTTN